uniref:HtrA serine peptidase 4 n=1 Tax=Otolemur garnettii TaxID=30611 RepID=H0XD24_OTOGA
RSQLRPAGLGRLLLLWLLLPPVPVPKSEARKSRASLSCPVACEPTRCPPLPTCSAETTPVLDRCRCCRVCPAAEGEACGGARGRPCAQGLQCSARFGGRLGTCGCRAAGAAVCGSDGRTYPSLCALRAENRAARLRGALPAVPVQKGDCSDPGTQSAGLLRSEYNFIAAVVEKVAPSVVHLQLFRRNRSPLSSKDIPVSSGSGFLVSEDGLIITNAHVITNQQRIQVELQSGAQYEATVKDIDHRLDLALIKIEPNADLPVLLLGRSSDLRAGEFVVALGSPFSLQNTVTAGIVSTTQRGGKELGLKDSDMDYIQTDAIINHGNSGGPLVNLDGDVIGINTLKVTAGISFAIPSDRIRQFLAEYHERQLKGKALSQKKYLGLRMLPLTMKKKKTLGDSIRSHKGVTTSIHVILQPILEQPSDLSGLRDHDVIVSINGQPVTTTTDVTEAVKNNDSLSITVHRGSQILFLTVTPEIINDP